MRRAASLLLAPALLAPILLAASACSAEPASPDAIAAVREAGLCGKVEHAAELLAPIVAAHGDDPAVALLAGDVAAWRDRDDDALDHYRRAAELAPDDDAPHLHAAYVLIVRLGMEDGALDRARVQVAEALRDTGGTETAAILAAQGEIAWVEGDTERAEERFRAALAERPTCRWALQRLVQLLPPDAPDLADLRARLDAARTDDHRGEGMSRGRSPVTFCGE